MLLIPCTQIRVFRPDAQAVRSVSEKYHAISPVVIRAMVTLWEAASDEQRKQALHKAATDTLEENALEVQAVEDRQRLARRNPTRPVVPG